MDIAGLVVEADKAILKRSAHGVHLASCILCDHRGTQLTVAVFHPVGTPWMVRFLTNLALRFYVILGACRRVRVRVNA